MVPAESWRGYKVERTNSDRFPTRFGAGSVPGRLLRSLRRRSWPSAESTPYGSAALMAEVKALSEVAEGGRNEALNVAAFKLGRLVAGGELTEKAAFDGLVIACEANGLMADEPGKSVATTERAFADAAEQPRKAPERPERVAEPAAKAGPVNPLWELMLGRDDLKNLPDPEPYIFTAADADTLTQSNANLPGDPWGDVRTDGYVLVQPSVARIDGPDGVAVGTHAFLCGVPGGGRCPLVVDRAHHADARQLWRRWWGVEPVAPVDHDRRPGWCS